MANPTRQEILEAHDALGKLSFLVEDLAATVEEARRAWNYHDSVLAALPPKPELTTAEIGWDNDEYYLSEADHSAYGLVIMIGEGIAPDTIRVVRAGGHACEVAAGDLTPTGHRYVRS